LTELKLWIWRAVLCGIGGASAVAGITGLGIAITWFVVPADTMLKTTGTALVAASFPLLLLAAHCLDRIEAAEKDLKKMTNVKR